MDHLLLSPIFTLPNLLSLSRLLLLPFILFSLFHKTFHFSFFIFHFSLPGEALSLILMILCVLSDGLDGYIARRRKQVTQFGKVMDPLIDKILTVTIILSLIPLRGFPLWVAFLILLRDLAILLGSFLLLKGRKIVPTSTPIGKLTGFSYAMMVISYVLRLEGFSRLTTVTSTFLVFLSGFHYLFRFLKLFRTTHEIAGVSTSH